MARIPMMNGFEPLAEGIDTYFIQEAKYDEFGTMTISFLNVDNKVHKERYQLQDSKGNTNEGALIAFSYLCKSVLNDPNLTECDTDLLVGKFVEATCTHTVVESKKTPGVFNTYAHLGNWQATTYWNRTPGQPITPLNNQVAPSPQVVSQASVPPVPTPTPQGTLDLNAMLGVNNVANR